MKFTKFIGIFVIIFTIMACGVSKKEQKNTLNYNEITNEEITKLIEMVEELETLHQSFLIYKRYKILTGEEKFQYLKNVEENIKYLKIMPPERAVAIMSSMDALDVVIVFHKTEEIAIAEGTTSIVSHWLSLMENQENIIKEKILSELEYRKQKKLISNDEYEKANSILEINGINNFIGTELCNKIFIDNIIVKIYNNEYYDK